MSKHLFLLGLFLIFACGENNTVGPEPVNVHPDRAVLVQLYSHTGGTGWTEQRGWLSDRPISEWYGIGTNAQGYVTEIVLNDNSMSGQFSAVDLSDLSSLEILELAGNELSGPMPNWLTSISTLRVLNIGRNELTGPLPAVLGNMTTLEVIDVRHNVFNGPIPAELGKLTNLKRLDFHGNALTGTVPASLGNLTNLTLLWLVNNKLSGPIPAEFVNLSLESFYWGNNDGLCVSDTLTDWIDTIEDSVGPICDPSSLESLKGRVVAALDSLVMDIERDRPDGAKEYVERMTAYLTANPLFFGSAAAIMDSTGAVTSCPYVYRSSSGLVDINIATPEYNVEGWDWFTMPLATNKGVWIPPFYDEGGGDIWMTTRSVPARDDRGVFAIVTTDLEVDPP